MPHQWNQTNQVICYLFLQNIKIIFIYEQLAMQQQKILFFTFYHKYATRYIYIYFDWWLHIVIPWRFLTFNESLCFQQKVKDANFPSLEGHPLSHFLHLYIWEIMPLLIPHKVSACMRRAPPTVYSYFPLMSFPPAAAELWPVIYRPVLPPLSPCPCTLSERTRPSLSRRDPPPLHTHTHSLRPSTHSQKGYRNATMQNSFCT